MGSIQCGLFCNSLKEFLETKITFRPTENENGIASLLSNFREVPFSFGLHFLLHLAPQLYIV